MKIICQNSNGITAKIKQIPHVDIIVLTETHQITKEKEKTLQYFHNYKGYHSNGNPKSKGLAILLKPDIKHKLIHISNMGNYIAIEFEHQTETYNLIGIYLEPEDYATARLKTVVTEIENIIKDKENIILIGDFNSLKDQIDCKIRTIQTRNLIQKHNTLIAPILNKYNLTDIWREQNTNTTEFTHITNNHRNKTETPTTGNTNKT